MSDFEKMCRHHKLGVNATKSKVVIVERKGESYCNVRIDTRTLNVVIEFAYLGDC